MVIVNNKYRIAVFNHGVMARPTLRHHLAKTLTRNNRTQAAYERALSELSLPALSITADPLMHFRHSIPPV